MPDNMTKDIWIIGAGPMTRAYIKVLDDLKISYQVLGRGIESAKECEEKTGAKVVTGGLENYISDSIELPSAAIVALGSNS